MFEGYLAETVELFCCHGDDSVFNLKKKRELS